MQTSKPNPNHFPLFGIYGIAEMRAVGIYVVRMAASGRDAMAELEAMPEFIRWVDRFPPNAAANQSD